jgi:hypothetical protein
MNRNKRMSKIEDSIRRIENLNDEKSTVNGLELLYQSKVLPFQPWDETEFQEKLGVQIPEELAEMWSLGSELRIHCEINYSQWGLILWSPLDCLKNQSKYTTRRPEHFVKGDLFIGEYLGDLDLVLIRCNLQEPDFSRIVIADAIDPRSNWLTVANSLSEFINQTLDNPENKFWDKSN